MRKFIVIISVGILSSISLTASSQVYKEEVINAPGFADFLMVDGETVWATNRGRVEQWSRKGKIAEVPMSAPCGAMTLVDYDMWLADCKERTINRIDTRTAKLTATVATGLGPSNGELSVVSGAGSIWVASDAKGVIARVDPAMNKVIASIVVDPNTFYLAFAFGSLWAVSDSEQTIQRIDPSTNRVIKRTKLGLQSSFLAAGDDALWVVEQGDGSVARVDAGSGDVTGRVKIRETLQYSDIDTGGGKIWVRTKLDHNFVVVDPKSLKILNRIGEVSQGSGGLRYTPAGIWTSQHDVQQLTWWPDPEKLAMP